MNFNGMPRPFLNALCADIRKTSRFQLTWWMFYILYGLSSTANKRYNLASLSTTGQPILSKLFRLISISIFLNFVYCWLMGRSGYVLLNKAHYFNSVHILPSHRIIIRIYFLNFTDKCILIIKDNDKFKT